MRILLILLLSVAAFGQSTQNAPAFEAADIRPSPSTTIPFMTGGVLRGERYELRTATMVDLIKTAYGVDEDSQVVGGPSWLAANRFNIIAKAPASTPPETLQKMLQTLLSDRFKLAVHNDKRSLPVYVLTVGKNGLKIKKSEGTSGSGCNGQPQTPQPGAVTYTVVSCRSVTMAEFAENLRGMVPAYINDPVQDSTQLQGSWDFDVKWTPRGQLVAAGSDGITIFDAVEKQLGLKLELQDITMPVIVVDRVNDKPTDNLPGVTEMIPPAPTEFEVAVVKPTDPDSKVPPGGGIQPGGRIDAHGVTLMNMITLAWDIRPDMVVGPKWLDTDRFDMVAKAPNTGPESGKSAGPPIDVETLRTMLRALIVERFKMVSHREDQAVNAYVFVAPKVETKLKKADPANRSECKKVSGPPSNPSLTQSYACTNTTMAQLATQIQTWAPAYLDRPVVDSTELSGAWDFVVSWSPKALITNPGSGDPSGGFTIFEAVDKQLGLKLVSQKHTMSVLVIDRVEQKPTNQ
jgi:uncharacterized protein (TIGR03435 family)